MHFEINQDAEMDWVPCQLMCIYMELSVLYSQVPRKEAYLILCEKYVVVEKKERLSHVLLHECCD